MDPTSVADGAVDDDSWKAELAAAVERGRPAGMKAQEFVLETMRAAIMSDTLHPGLRLRQEEVAEIFGTSRIPVRDGLRALEFEGLVVSEPNRGFAVASFDADDVEEVFDLRIVLESHAVRLAVPLLTDDDLAVLADRFTAMQAADAQDDHLATREAFYQTLYAVTGRPRLINHIDRLRQEVARVLRWAATISHSAAIHEGFYEAVRAGDAEEAVAQLSAHYQRVSLLIRRRIRENEAREVGSRRIPR